MASLVAMDGEDATSIHAAEVKHSHSICEATITHASESDQQPIDNDSESELQQQASEGLAEHDGGQKEEGAENDNQAKEDQENNDKFVNQDYPLEEQKELYNQPKEVLEKDDNFFNQDHPLVEQTEIYNQPNEVQEKDDNVLNQYRNHPLEADQDCECTMTNTTFMPFTCGGCLEVFSTICKLHGHLQYSHTDTELYYFDKGTQTAYPRFGTSCKITQTETEAIQNTAYNVTNHVSGKKSQKGKRKYVRKAVMNFPNLSWGDVSQARPDAAIRSEFQMTEPGQLSVRLGSDDLQRDGLDNLPASQLTNSMCEFSGPDIAIKMEVITDDYEKAPYGEILPVSAQKAKPKKRSVGKNKKVKTNVKEVGNKKVKTSLNEVENKEKKIVRKKERKKKSIKTDDNQGEVQKEKTKRPRGEGPRRCMSCRQKFDSPLLLREHMKIAELCRPRCSICDKSFSTKVGYKQHTSVFHIPPANPDEHNHMCENCGKTFKYPSSLYVHHKTCLDIRPFVCPEENCDKTYRRKIDLEIHMRYHSKDKAFFVCEFCGNGYVRLNALHRHMQGQHSKERTFKCDECPKSFFRNGMLLKHKKIHTKNYPFVCECGKSFIDKWNYNAHRRQHTGEKPYKCENCGAAFAHNVSKRNHMKNCGNGNNDM